MLNREPPVSLLFVPASAPDRFDKALASGASLVCLDLEDAVAPQDKSSARANALEALSSHVERARLCVRINPMSSIDGLHDAAALAVCGPAAVMLPKVETGRDVELLAATIPQGSHVAALVETPRGVEAAFEIAREPAVSFLMFGSFDYVAETGGTQDWAGLLPVRSRLVAAAAAAGRSAIDSPFSDLVDVEGAARENRASRDIGMAGRAAIHPRMIPGISSAYSPGDAELAEARRIVTAFEEADGGVARLGGKLIEAPVALRMRRMLDRAAGRR